MKLNKVLLTGIVGGAVVWVYYFLTHGLILADMYMKHSVFITESANPIWFVFNTVLVALAGALLFAKTRGSWAEGIKGGLTFGFFCRSRSIFLPVFQFTSPGMGGDRAYWLACLRFSRRHSIQEVKFCNNS